MSRCWRGFDGADLIGFHGQTLAHEPRGRGTHQMGDGAALAEALGVPVVWDFRSRRCAAGRRGRAAGAVLSFCLCQVDRGRRAHCVSEPWRGRQPDLGRPDAWTRPEEDGALLAFDTGPANAPINDLMHGSGRGAPFDRDGALARAGVRWRRARWSCFWTRPYFRRMPPKSLDRDDFSDMIGLVREL